VEMDSEDTWVEEKLRQKVEEYYAIHERICLDPGARNLRHTYVIPSEDKKLWRVQQVLVDPDEHNDWVIEFEVDLARAKAEGEMNLRLVKVGSLV
jgi:hypothetical protein